MQSPVLRDSPGSLSGLLERERLFAAILAEARTHGFRGTSVEAVAEGAGLRLLYSGHTTLHSLES